MATKKSHKSEITFFQSSSRLFQLNYFVQELNFQKEMENFVVACLRHPLKMKLSCFRRSRAVTEKKCTKKPDARADLMFCFLNQLLF